MRERIKKMGVWSRLALVITVCWLVGAAVGQSIYEVGEYESAMAEAMYNCRHRIVTNGETLYDFNVPPFNDCEAYYGYRIPRSKFWIDNTMFAIQWAFAAWIVAGIMFLVARWILAGRTTG